MMKLIDERERTGSQDVGVEGLDNIIFYLGEGYENCKDADEINQKLAEENDGMVGYKVVEAEELLHLNSFEIQELAHNLDWGNPYTDPEDIKDSLRTNWEQQMDEESVEAVYKVMCEIWDDKNNQ